MLFNSLEFLWFFPTVILLYFIMRPQYRWALLLVASYYFYMAWKPEYILLIVISTLIDYYCGRKMGEIEEKKKRRPYLYASLLSNLGILFTFKYFGFFNDSLRTVVESLGASYHGPTFDLILPMGISFYTFQTLSYSVDVYNGNLKPEKHLGIFALFVSFFPQLVAGPIERASNLLPQFHKVFRFESARVNSGLRQMLWGMFKKVVVADRLAVLVNAVYNDPTEFGGLSLMLATFFFAFQIYCDFSGYSDIAIGAAKVMGYDLMTNFRTPYFSKSISEFWKRWHISLSTWFRDYVYIPMGGNRVVKWRWYYNLLITFLVSGLWHGANWTFVIWGGLHGFYLVASILLAPLRAKSNKLLGLKEGSVMMKAVDVLMIFSLVCLGWIFFRANTVQDAFYICTHLFSGIGAELATFVETLKLMQISLYLETTSGASLGMTIWDLFLAFSGIGFICVVEYIASKAEVMRRFNNLPVWLKWSVYWVLIYSIIFFRSFSSSEFIYFQF
ncbi:MAG: MBOAT family O-acyltransferase [Bacteroidota bacterium]